MKLRIGLNCDLGEGLDALDAAVMPYLDCANIACGGHAGDANSMRRTLVLAKASKVKIGAHPSYPDKTHFGRQSMKLSPEELQQSLLTQVAALRAEAQHIDMVLSYIKPHGALYNDCIDPQILAVVLAVAQITQLPLMLMAGNAAITAQCQAARVELITEAFADRGYTSEGTLIQRGQAGDLLDQDASLTQVKNLFERQGLWAQGPSEPKWLPLDCASICVHSDTPKALEQIKAIAHYLRNAHLIT